MPPVSTGVTDAPWPCTIMSAHESDSLFFRRTLRISLSFFLYIVNNLFSVVYHRSDTANDDKIHDDSGDIGNQSKCLTDAGLSIYWIQLFQILRILCSEY